LEKLRDNRMFASVSLGLAMSVQGAFQACLAERLD